MKPITKIMAGAIAAFCMTAPLFAGEMPFPQGKNYGTRPSGSTYALAAAVETQYARYVDTWWRSEGYIYSTDTHNDGLTVSEAHGYGMMIFAIMDDQAKFDKMVSYYESNKAWGTHLMTWKIGGGWTGGSATDGDLDIAYALIIAEQQWPGNGYLDKAKLILGSIWDEDINADNMPHLGSNWTDHYIYRPSDWMAGHFRAFEKVDGGRDWDKVSGKLYDNFWWFQTETTTSGLISDFVKDGKPSAIGESAHDTKYFYNACRVPLRFAMDYARHKGENNNQDALSTVMNPLLNATEGNAANVKTGYNLDGSVISGQDFNGLEFLAPYGAGLIAMGDQDAMNSAWKEMQQPWTTTNDTRSFGDALKLLSMLVMSGNWWTYGDANTYEPLIIDTNGIIFDHFGNAFGDGSGQTHLGALNGVNWGDEKYIAPGGDTTYYHGGGYYYAFQGDGSSVKSAAGKALTSENMDDIVTDNKLNVTFSMADGGYAGIGAEIIAGIVEEGDSVKSVAKTADLSKLTGVTLRYKSSADLTLALETNDIFEKAGYGGYEYNLPKSEEMTQVTIPVEDFALPEIWEEVEPGKWENVTPTKLEGLSWGVTGKVAVKALAIQGYSEKAADVTLEVEEIYLNGIQYEDLGLKFREPTPTSIKGGSVAKKLGIQTAVTADAINLTFPEAQAGVAAVSLFTMNGREMVSQKAAVGAGSSSMRVSTAGLATGVYLMRVNVNGVVTSSQIAIR